VYVYWVSPILRLRGGVGVSFTPFYQYEYYWLNGIFRSSGTTSYVRYLVPYLTGTYRQTVGNKVSGSQ
jgi:hypothetical protein